MPLPTDRQQRVSRLTPWRDALTAIERLAAPVASETVALAEGVGCVAADDVRVEAPVPAVSIAACNGWAVRADLVADAGPYAPVPFAVAPVWVESGEPLPAGCDSILPPDAVTAAGGAYEAVATAGPGEGVTVAGADASPDLPLVQAGKPIGPTACAALEAAGIATVRVRRPRIGLVCLGAPALQDGPVFSLIGRALGQCGALTVAAAPTPALAALVATENLDALVTIGGTGQGRRDKAAFLVAAAGEMSVHGVGIRPGETAGLGSVEGRPVLLLPGRLDAALAAWLLLGLPLLRRLNASTDTGTGGLSTLTRKLTSSIGLAEAVLVAREGEGVRPIAAGVFPFTALARADGWVLVPPESEGYASGTQVAVNPLP